MATPRRSPRKNPDTFEVEKHLRHFCEISSQELGNALGTVLGELDFALSSHQPQAQEHSMLVAVAAVERAIALARNLRYFSLHTQLDIHAHDITAVLLDTVDLVERELEFRKVQITVRAEAGILMNIDAAAIQQVILNLMINAAEAMPGGGRLTITLTRLSQTVEIRFQDTGSGIPKDRLDNLFVPYRSEKFKTSEVKGLGLTVAKALIDSHGGEIRFETRSLHGTTFTLELPYSGSKKGKIHQETRKYRRVRVHIPVVVTLPNRQVKTQVSILSLGGCYVRLPSDKKNAFPQVNDRISIEIQYFGEDSITANARVKNLCWAGQQSGIGLEFLELTLKARKLIDAIVRSHSL